MMVIPILEPALGDFAGALAVSTIEPNDRRFRTTVYSLAVTDWASDRYVIKIVCRLVHLKAPNDEAKAKTHRSRIIATTPTSVMGHLLRRSEQIIQIAVIALSESYGQCSNSVQRIRNQNNMGGVDERRKARIF